MLRFLNALFILGALAVFLYGVYHGDGETMVVSVVILVAGELQVLLIKARVGWWAFFGDDIDDT